MSRLLTPLFLLLTTLLAAQPQLRFEAAAPTFSQPLGIVSSGYAPEGNLLYIVEKGGLIKVYNQDIDAVQASFFLDFRMVVDDDREGGLLGLVFHPDYPNVRQVFVQYTRTRGGQLESVISRFDVSINGAAAVPSSEEVLLTIDQPRNNHLAGDLAFGSDGYLYIPTGDSGGGGDPGNVAQDLGSLLGKMLRIDVDGTDPGLSYAIPPDNPFVGVAGVRPEIWAYGLRNPFRISFDTNGDLYIADVGQNAREEINRQSVADGGGQNYGWDCREGDIAFPNVSQRSPACDTASNFTDPFYSYTHSSNGGRASVTGGGVHRGLVDDLVGYYVFGDFVSGDFFLIDVAGAAGGGNATATRQANANFGPSSIAAFGIDNRGYNYVAHLGAGRIYRIVTEAELPVELTAWTAKPLGKRVRLAWTTAREEGAADFLLERSADGVSFEPLGIRVSPSTTNQPRDYEFFDAAPLNGISYYRLTQRDLDGGQEVFDIRRVEFGAPKELSVRPNPAGGNLVTVGYRAEAPVEANLQIHDAFGRVVVDRNEALVEGQNEWNLRVGDLEPGFYTVRLFLGREPVLSKVIIR